MISSIRIKNYQSHKDSILNFSPGINAIVGSSDNGKTATLRAFNWVLNNRPTGFNNVSYWDRGKDKKPKTEQSVSIFKYNGDCVTRIRTKDYNGYEFYSQEEVTKLEAVGTDVPEEVSLFFNMNETNIQKQMDQPFMVSESSAEVARFFNRIIRLDIIDKVLSNAETVRRRNNKDIEELKNSIDKNIKDLEELNWVDKAQELTKEALELKEVIIKNLVDDYSKINVLLTDAERYDEEIRNSRSYDEAIELMNSIEILYKEIEGLQYDKNNLSELIAKCDQFEKEVSEHIDLSYAVELMEDIEDLHNCILKKVQDRIALDKLLNEYEITLTNISDYGKEVDELGILLPDTCPLCGGEL